MPTPRRNRLAKPAVTVVILVITALFAAMTWEFVFGGNRNTPLTTLTPRGRFSDSIQRLNTPVFGVAMVVFVLVIGGIGFIAFKFRDRGEDDEDLPPQLHGNTVLELGWTILPAVILMVVAVFTVLTLMELNKPDNEAMKVQVAGQQWWWGYHYDLNTDGNYSGSEDLTTSTELVIPVGRVVELDVTSNDVIHSFWIPALNGKRDAVPGQHHPWKLQAKEAGVFRGQCTEFCGLSHANMRMLVRAIPADQFDKWVANQRKPAVEPAAGSDAAAGKTLFTNLLCSSCHLINGVTNDKVTSDAGAKKLLASGVAPDLTHLMSRGTFIGSIANLYSPDDPDHPGQVGDPNNVSEPGNPGGALFGEDAGAYQFNRTALESWLRAPEKMKPMANKANKDGVYRGMPNLGLSEQQIDQLVAYLSTLK